MQELNFEQHPLFLILCMASGVAYAFIQYQKKGSWSKSMNMMLAVIRAITVSMIAALLVAPIIRLIINEIEKPEYVIAIDNSKSLTHFRDSTGLKTLIDFIYDQKLTLENQGFKVSVKSLSSDDQEIKFINTSSNLTELLSGIQSEYEGRNLAGVLLLTDGIYNQGMSPAFRNYSFPIKTIGVGDTIPKSDISIHSLLFNKLAYQGNKFPIVARIENQGFKGKQVTLTVKNGNKSLAQQKVVLGGNDDLKEIKFLIDATQSGYQRYIVQVTSLPDEFTTSNNQRSAFVEVVEGKETIALISGSPHPDIKAIRSAVESNSNYIFESYVLSNPKDLEKLTNSPRDFDLVIYHQLSNARRAGQISVEEIQSKATSSLTIFGSQNDIRQFNTDNDIVKITLASEDYDDVTAAFNPAFENFKLTEELQSSFDQFPPVSVPFGNYTVSETAQTMLFQRVGNITTKRPLLTVKTEEGVKSAIFMGAGLWKWKLTDYANNGNNEYFNELITKLVQYLTTKDDKRKFRVYPIKNEFSTTENVVFESEVYNDLYEPIYNKKINIKLTNEEGKSTSYQYITSKNNTQFEIGGLTNGVYKYEASTSMPSGLEKITGEFLIKELQLESQNLTADFQLLRKIANQTDGNFYTEQQLSDLSISFSELEAQGIIHSRELLKPFINLEWLLILFLGLLSLEWFLRKYHGSY